MTPYHVILLCSILHCIMLRYVGANPAVVQAPRGPNLHRIFVIRVFYDSDPPKILLKEIWYQQNRHQERLCKLTRRPASADRTARRQFQATGQPVSRTQASDTMTSRLPRYEAKCVQRRCFQSGSVPLHSDIKGTDLPPANILIPLERQLIVLQLCRWQFLYNVDFCIG